MINDVSDHKTTLMAFRCNVRTKKAKGDGGQEKFSLDGRLGGNLQENLSL